MGSSRLNIRICHKDSLPKIKILRQNFLFWHPRTPLSWSWNFLKFAEIRTPGKFLEWLYFFNRPDKPLYTSWWSILSFLTVVLLIASRTILINWSCTSIKRWLRLGCGHQSVIIHFSSIIVGFEHFHSALLSSRFSIALLTAWRHANCNRNFVFLTFCAGC